ncbi:hypothetical protein RHMOL_Rhmol11G0002900 [Rhododendron molle]|uniref:Uncharacterized protein n=1 Tax=Rhododendron molle TaxID=49168 RepID=A0ACC0LNA5_RHOML|nr:hypothetical protein RHMOL_Rhmol11G0002900 [Rhododendron molle]
MLKHSNFIGLVSNVKFLKFTRDINRTATTALWFLRSGTPLWRNGPPETQILCNACGSRWRTKGTLLNYTPLHARAEPDEFEDYRVSRVKSLSIKNREAEVLKRKQNNENEVVERVALYYDQGSREGLDDDNSNRSSSGSATRHI